MDKMDRNISELQDFQELQSFIEDTKKGKFSEDDISFREILQCTIVRESVSYIEDVKVQNIGTVLYGIY